MIKFLLFLSIIIIFSLYKIFINYNIYKNKKETILEIALLLYLIWATIFSKFMFIYFPILLLHFLSLLIAWGIFFTYLYKKTKTIWPLLLPLISIIIFFISGILVARFD